MAVVDLDPDLTAAGPSAIAAALAPRVGEPLLVRFDAAALAAGPESALRVWLRTVPFATLAVGEVPRALRDVLDVRVPDPTAADRLAPFCRPRGLVPLPPWRAGISIIIPERDAPEMLGAALAALATAQERVAEAAQVIVVANGAPAAGYVALAQQYPHVEFVFSEAPLGFAGAIERGLAEARHDWTYLLNNDMTLDANALAALLPARGDDVFAIASQIFQRDAAGRREETGFTDWYVDEAGVRLFHAPVRDEREVRPHLCASGGAALFRTALLRRYLRGSRCYDPFYWEDVEWGLRAWRDGLRVLFCPRSQAQHRHRATTARFFPQAEIERIVQRNRMLFDARHRITGNGIAWLMDRICDLPYASQREFARLRVAAGVFRQRFHALRPPQPAAPPVLPAPGQGALALPPTSYSYR
ncbi:MAG: glycosyltransferase, partial [Deltaproteobacteria bacterium]